MWTRLMYEKKEDVRKAIEAYEEMEKKEENNK